MPQIYHPILRNKQNERDVVQSFGGLTHFEHTNDRVIDLEPIIEIGGDTDLNDLDPFVDASNGVLVDLPVYQMARDTSFGNAVESAVTEYDGRVGFYQANADCIDRPVVSGRIETPVDYDIHHIQQQALRDYFRTVVHRLMIRLTGPLTDSQRESISTLAESLRPTDQVLFDIPDTGYSDGLRENLRFLSRTFSDNQLGVLNVFNPFDGDGTNRTPYVAEEFGMDGFGDFAINVRYPGNGYQGDTVIIRHYHPSQSVVREFDGSTYEGASDDLTDWNEWQTQHCDFCRDADLLSTGGMSTRNPNAWKQIRMGHYLTSMLRSEL